MHLRVSARSTGPAAFQKLVPASSRQSDGAHGGKALLVGVAVYIGLAAALGSLEDLGREIRFVFLRWGEAI